MLPRPASLWLLADTGICQDMGSVSVSFSVWEEQWDMEVCLQVYLSSFEPLHPITGFLEGRFGIYFSSSIKLSCFNRFQVSANYCCQLELFRCVLGVVVGTGVHTLISAMRVNGIFHSPKWRKWELVSCLNHRVLWNLHVVWNRNALYFWLDFARLSLANIERLGTWGRGRGEEVTKYSLYCYGKSIPNICKRAEHAITDSVCL